MGRQARKVLLETLSPGERFDRGIELADRMVEAYLSRLPEPLDVEEGEEVDPETRRRRFQALRSQEARRGACRRPRGPG